MEYINNIAQMWHADINIVLLSISNSLLKSCKLSLRSHRHSVDFD